MILDRKGRSVDHLVTYRQVEEDDDQDTTRRV